MTVDKDSGTVTMPISWAIAILLVLSTGVFGGQAINGVVSGTSQPPTVEIKQDLRDIRVQINSLSSQVAEMRGEIRAIHSGD